MKTLSEKAIALLQDLISISSFSSEEDKTAARIGQWFKEHNIPFQQQGYNVYAMNLSLIHI